jgi:exopolysaccharide biosynthesis polyprenyl glycosylphosphotransferase
MPPSSEAYIRKSSPGAIAKLFLSQSAVPWIVMDFVVGASVFYLFALLGKETHLAQVREENLITALVLALFFCVAGLGSGLYERENRLRRFETIRLSLLSWAMAMAFGIALIHFVLFVKVGRFSLIFGSLGALAAIIFVHLLLEWMLRSFPLRFLVLGPATKTSEELLKYSLAPEQRHYVHGDELRQRILSEPELSSERIVELLRQENILDLVLTSDTRAIDRNTKIATLALQLGIRVIDEGRFYAELFRRYPIEHLSQNWVLTAGFDIQKPATHFLKRSFDIVFSSLLLILLSPVFLLIALLIKGTSPGPVLYFQLRQGRYSRPFKVLKFRSMFHETNAQGSHATSRRDLRISFAGRILRPLHFDELPQLINILKGEMSFVGPRPEALPIVKKIQSQVPIYDIRHMIRPGLTGFAQINMGKTEDGLDEMMRKLSFDLYYLRNYSLTMDLLIMLRTFFVLTKSTW